MRDVPMLRVVHRDRPLGQSAAFLSGARAASLICWSSWTALRERSGRRGSQRRRYKENDADNTRIAVLGQRAVRKDNSLRRISSGTGQPLAGACSRTGRATPDAA